MGPRAGSDTTTSILRLSHDFPYIIMDSAAIGK